jgi:nitroreductase
MEVIEALKSRRSIRKFADRDVPSEVLDEIFEIVRYTPSWANTQVWEFIVIRDPKMKADLAATLPPNNPSKNAVELAPVVVAACGKTKSSGFYRGQETTIFGDWLLFDVALAVHQLNLAAHSYGLGMVHVGLFDHRSAAHLLGIPEEYRIVELLPLGYPESEPPTPRRREAAEFVHLEKFTKRAN